MVLNDSNREETAFQEITNCRAMNIGVSGFAECLCEGPNNCAFALPFGYAFLCQHPRMGEIIANTEKEKQGSSQAH